MKQGDELDQKYSLALICVGSNVTSIWGNPRETIEECAAQLAVVFETEVESSPIFRTPAFPAGAGPDFANAAFVFRTARSGDDVLTKLHEIEARAERKRQERWGARTLDLDLIGLGDVIAPDIETWTNWAELSLEKQKQLAPEQLILPHPRVHERAFALIPLMHVAKDWMHPVLKRSVSELTAALPQALKDEVIPYE